jgi:hypothetical protein
MIYTDWQYPEGAIKCKNYAFCETGLPEWWFDCKRKYICTNCDMLYGTWGTTHKGKGELVLNKNIECPICFENNLGVTLPNCEHAICIDCFKRCHNYGDKFEEPEFPYPDIDDEYYADEDNLKWNNDDYPLLKGFKDEYNKWEHEYEEGSKNENYLKYCPICRK